MRFWRGPDLGEHRWGTVPYHRAQARWWRRCQLFNAVLAGVVLGLVAVQDLWVLRALDGLVLFSCGMQWVGARQQASKHRILAWEAEATGTLEGMRASALFSIDEAAETLASMPPPGSDPKAWRQSIHVQRRRS